MQSVKYLGIDIGGTWIKGTLVDDRFINNHSKPGRLNFAVKKIKSPLSPKARSGDLFDALTELLEYFDTNPEHISAIGISTAGIVNYAGTRVVKSAVHLDALKNEDWKNDLERQFKCRVILINDADAAAIGLAELGYLKGNNTIGIMPIGTGLGFSVWKNGRRWRPGKSFPLLGSIKTPAGRYDSIVSVSKLAALEKGL